MKRVRIWFLGIEAALYAAFLTLDLLGASPALSDGLKFAAITLVALAGLSGVRTRDGRVVAMALALTAAADVCLLLLGRGYMIGVALFLCVQVLYTLRLCRMSGARFSQHCAVRAVLALSAAYLLKAQGALVMLVGAYITWFFFNLVQSAALAAQTRTRQTRLFALGLALFFLCDLCVGIHNLPRGALSAFADVAMWGFYLPGQVLILLSANALGGAFDEA